MKKFVIALLILALFAVPSFALDFGVQYSKQTEGLQNDFFGVTVKVFEEKFLGLDLLALTPNLGTSSDPIENALYMVQNSDDITTAELLPFLRMNIKVWPFWLYLGAAPVLDMSFPFDGGGNRQFDVALRTPYEGVAKAGLQLNFLIVGAYAEVSTYFDQDFNTYDYRASVGAVINF